jgi:hypothetical protein
MSLRFHLLRRTNRDQLTALPQGNIARLHATVHLWRIVGKIRMAPPGERSRVLPQPLARNK